MNPYTEEVAGGPKADALARAWSILRELDRLLRLMDAQDAERKGLVGILRSALAVVTSREVRRTDLPDSSTDVLFGWNWDDPEEGFEGRPVEYFSFCLVCKRAFRGTAKLRKGETPTLAIRICPRCSEAMPETAFPPVSRVLEAVATINDRRVDAISRTRQCLKGEKTEPEAK